MIVYFLVTNSKSVICCVVGPLQLWQLKLRITKCDEQKKTSQLSFSLCENLIYLTI